MVFSGLFHMKYTTRLYTMVIMLCLLFDSLAGASAGELERLKQANLTLQEQLGEEPST